MINYNKRHREKHRTADRKWRENNPLGSKKLLPSETKICTKCKTEKKLKEFYPMKGGKYGVTALCKTCNIARLTNYNLTHVEQRKKYWEQYRIKNKEVMAEYARRKHYIKTYGITIEQKFELWEKQNKKCAICFNSLPDFMKAHIDHDHKTKKIRGLLCHFCNHMIGNSRDNSEYLKNGIGYLQEMCYKAVLSRLSNGKVKYKTLSPEVTRIFLDVEMLPSEYGFLIEKLFSKEFMVEFKNETNARSS